MKVVVGLGNPGAKYEGTRHNIGFEVLNYLAAAPGASAPRVKFQSRIVEQTVAGQVLWLVQPQTFMNLSGRAVRELVDFYKLPLSELLVLSDDLNLPVGKLRMRTSGSHGGQNGLRNIQECLGTEQYARLRLGIGTPGPGEAVDYVLGRFKPGERLPIEEAIARAAQAVLLWVKDGPAAAMNFANAGEAKPAPKKPRPLPPPATARPEPNSKKPPDAGYSPPSGT